MKLKKLDSIAIWSENWKGLAEWYEKMFPLELVEELNLDNDTGRFYKFGEAGQNNLWIGFHDQVHGKSKDPFRIMIGLEVESVEETFKELKEKGVEFIAEPQVSPTNDYHVATAKDLDGNIIQLYSFDV